ncbi:MAG: GTP pyrophosphokinase family protein [Clostridia bacterium]|nr:GTP pyrophosphokinase family protein [Clostridia bacterium]
MQEYNNEKDRLGNLLLDSSEEEIRSIVSSMQLLMTYYKCAMHEIEAKFKVLNEEFSLQHERNPIESIKTRLKSIDSINHKLKKYGYEMSPQSIWDNLNDVAGVRVVCSFMDDIYMLADCLTSQDDVKLIAKKDYIKNPKENGYRSLHLIIEVPIFLCNEKRYVRAEVQLRTIAMESWAKLEHRMRYKKELRDDLLEATHDKLLECAELSSLLDLKMQDIRDIIEGCPLEEPKKQ